MARSESIRDLLAVVRFTEQVSTRLHGAESRQEIYRRVCDAFREEKGYTCSFAEVDRPGDRFRVTDISINTKFLRAAEKLTGHRMGVHWTGISASRIYTDIIINRQTVCLPVMEVIRDVYPGLAASVLEKVVSLTGFRTMTLNTPLIVHDKVVGVMGLTTPGISPAMIPSMESFGRHVAVAVQLAEEAAARKTAEERLRTSLENTRKLLRESNHRIRDNLQVITSLLDLQGRTLDDDALRNILSQVRNRIRTIAFVHEGLYATADFRRVDLNGYLVQLTQNIYRTYGVNPNRIVLHNDIADIDMDVRQLIPFGLVLNELITNALTHAFPEDDERPFRIDLCVEKREHTILAVVSNNGERIPPEIDLASSKTFGLQLVHMLVTGQLHGKIAIDEGSVTSFVIEFPYQT